MPSFEAGQRPCPTGGFQGGFGPISGGFGRGQNGAPGEAQRSGFAGERRSSGTSEFSPLRGGNEGCGACDDDKQEKALALLWRLGGHFRPQCRRFQGLELALFRPTRFGIGAVFSQKPPESTL